MRNHKSRWRARRTWREYRAAFKRTPSLKNERAYSTNDMLLLLSLGHKPSKFVRRLAAL